MPSDVEPKPVDNVKSNVEAARSWAVTHERWRTARVALVCGTILVGLWLVLDAIRDVLDKPPGLMVIGGVMALLAPPSVVIWRCIVNFRAHIRTDHQRVIELEGKIDVNRESSGLTREGDTPADEP